MERRLPLPTAFAGRWQHEGQLVQVMADCKVNISVQCGATVEAVRVEGQLTYVEISYKIIRCYVAKSHLKYTLYIAF